jgi:hypothetical protein
LPLRSRRADPTDHVDDAGPGALGEPSGPRWQEPGPPAGNAPGDLMLLLGWTSDDMPRHYGASAAAERAQQVQARMGIGERV